MQKEKQQRENRQKENRQQELTRRTAAADRAAEAGLEIQQEKQDRKLRLGQQIRFRIPDKKKSACYLIMNIAAR